MRKACCNLEALEAPLPTRAAPGNQGQTPSHPLIPLPPQTQTWWTQSLFCPIELTAYSNGTRMTELFPFVLKGRNILGRLHPSAWENEPTQLWKKKGLVAVVFEDTASLWCFGLDRGGLTCYFRSVFKQRQFSLYSTPDNSVPHQENVILAPSSKFQHVQWYQLLSSMSCMLYVLCYSCQAGDSTVYVPWQ